MYPSGKNELQIFPQRGLSAETGMPAPSDQERGCCSDDMKTTTEKGRGKLLLCALKEVDWAIKSDSQVPEQTILSDQNYVCFLIATFYCALVFVTKGQLLNLWILAHS